MATSRKRGWRPNPPCSSTRRWPNRTPRSRLSTYSEDRCEEAERGFQAALRLNPNYSYAHPWRSHLLAVQGHLDEAVAEMDRALQIDPYSLSTLVIGSMMLSHADRHKEALVLGDRAGAVRQQNYGWP